jgi:PAS domain S-box-containing protein
MSAGEVTGGYAEEGDQRLFFGFMDKIPVPAISTGPEMSIKYVNPAFERLTGFSLAEVTGAGAPYPWWPEERREEYLAELRAIQGGKKHKPEWLFRTKRGQDFWISASVSPVKENGELRYLLATWFDITGYKEEEKALRDEIAVRNKLRLEMAENAWYRMQTPLTSIKGYISTLLQNDLKWNKVKVEEFLTEADHQADRRQLLIDNLMTMALIETGTLKLNQKRYLVTELLEAARPWLAFLQTQHPLSLNLGLGLPPVYADKIRLIQALGNLAEMVARFSTAGSRILLEAGVSGDWVVISLADTGGSAAGNPDAISNQVSEEKKAATAGSDTGLAISRGIIEAHGGELQLEYLPGTGFKIHFTLPAIREM